MKQAANFSHPPALLGVSVEGVPGPVPLKGAGLALKMTSRRTFLNSCLLALGVRVPKVAAAVPLAASANDVMLGEPWMNLWTATPISWMGLPSGGTDGSILTYTDHGYSWVHVEP